MSALGHKRTYAAQKPMSAILPIATAKAKFRKRQCPLYPRKRTCAVQEPMSAMGQKRTCAVQLGLLRKQRSRARQNHPNFSERSRLCVYLDCATVLLDNDVVADGEPQPGAFSGRLGCKERIEHLFFHIRRNAGAIVTDRYFNPVTKVLGRGNNGRLIIPAVRFRSALSRRI